MIAATGILELRSTLMRLFLAIFLPPLAFFTIGRPFAGLICLILWMTVIGWCLAALWAAFAVSEYEAEEKIRAHERRHYYY